MKLLASLALSALFTLSSIAAVADVAVKGYYRSNGTYVQPHYRSDPDRSFSNNWSTKGNINPHTGAVGTKTNPYSTGYQTQQRTSSSPYQTSPSTGLQLQR